MPSSMTSSLVRTRKAWGAPLGQPPEEGRDAHAGGAAPARHLGAVQRYHIRCASAAHLSSLLPGGKCLSLNWRYSIVFIAIQLLVARGGDAAGRYARDMAGSASR